jgi:uncharacterized protein DUF1344
VKTIAGVIAGLLLACGAAASGEEIQGKIRSLDSHERAFSLEDGTEIVLAEGVPMTTLKPGRSVKASYEERDGRKIATSVEEITSSEERSLPNPR